MPNKFYDGNTNHNKYNKIDPIPVRVSVLNVIHDGYPALQTDYLKYGHPRVSNVVKRDGSFKRILITGTAFRVIMIPVDAATNGVAAVTRLFAT